VFRSVFTVKISLDQARLTIVLTPVDSFLPFKIGRLRLIDPVYCSPLLQDGSGVQAYPTPALPRVHLSPRLARLIGCA
jgi:hypothetical protein